MSFIKDLKQLRSSGLVNAGNQANQVEADKADVKQGGEVLQPGKEPELKGGQGKPVAKKTGGLSGAALRTTVGDLFSVAEKVGLPATLIAKYASGMDQHVGAMKDAGARIAKALAGMDEKTRAHVTGLPAQLVLAMSKGLSAMDQASAGLQIKQIVELTADVLEGPRKLSAAHVRAFEVLAHATSQLNNGELAAELKRSAKMIMGKNDGLAVETAMESLDAMMPTLVAASDTATRAPMFRAALEISMLATWDAGRPAEDVVTLGVAGAKAQLTDGQKEVLAGFVDTVRQHNADRKAHEELVTEKLVGMTGQYDQTAGAAPEKFQSFGPIRARVDANLNPEARSIWYEQVNANAAHDEKALLALGQIQLAILEHNAFAFPQAELAGQVSGVVVALAQNANVTPAMIAKLAAEHIPAVTAERVPGTLAILSTILNQGVQLKTDGDLATLANALIGRTDAFAAQNGPAAQLVAALQGAPDEATWNQAIRHGARFAEVLSKAEPGPARDLLQQAFAKDVESIARQGLDLAALAGAYKGVPEDGLAHFVAVAEKHGRDPDKWLDQLSALFKHCRGNKEHIRAIRNFITLADNNGADVPKFFDQLLSGKPKSPFVTRTIHALLREENLQVSKGALDTAIDMLKRGENVPSIIEGRLQEGMVKNLNLEGILGDAKIKVTEHGLKQVTGSGALSEFFSEGANAAAVPKDILKGMLISVLEDKWDHFRFTTPTAAKQLAILEPEQQRAWMKPEVLEHVRFADEGKAQFDKRVVAGAAIAGKLVENMTAAWGDLDAMKAKQKELVEKLRGIDKNDRENRLPLVREIGSIPAQIAALEWAKELAAMTPETTTPLRFAAMGDPLPGLARLLGPTHEAAINELAWTVRIDDLAYSQVVTNDGPDLSTIYKLASTQCLRGWPDDIALLAYCVDANKRMIITKNQAGEERRAVMRIVTRTDEGHVGEPMLVLERSYPDNQAEEEKQRLVEHMLRRAVEMGISAAFPTEYYWDATKTNRRTIADMNAVLEDLNRRYNTTSQILLTNVTNPAGNINPEYIDSAPPGGIANAGNVTIRRYDGTQDVTYENRFLILTPKAD